MLALAKLKMEFAKFLFILRSLHILINSQVQGYERIVTDLTIMHSSEGVVLDYKFNETSENHGEGDQTLPSAPGCPRSYEGFPWFHYGFPPRCYLIGTTGPCPPGHLLFGNISSNTAYCSCMCPYVRHQLASSQIHTQSGNISVTHRDWLQFCELLDSEMNEAFLDRRTGRCYYLETQGYCPVGRWVVKDETGNGITCVDQCSISSGPTANHIFDYATRTCILAHKFHHVGPDGWQYSCEICSRNFAQTKNLRTHMRVHTKEKPFVCDICWEKYAHKHNWRSHMNNKTTPTSSHER